MMKKETYRVGRRKFIRTRWVGRRPAPPGERRVQYPGRIPERLAQAADKKRGRNNRGWAIEQAIALWVTMDDVEIRRMLSTETV